MNQTNLGPAPNRQEYESKPAINRANLGQINPNKKEGPKGARGQKKLHGFSNRCTIRPVGSARRRGNGRAASSLTTGRREARDAVGSIARCHHPIQKKQRNHKVYREVIYKQKLYTHNSHTGSPDQAATAKTQLETSSSRRPSRLPLAVSAATHASAAHTSTLAGLQHASHFCSCCGASPLAGTPHCRTSLTPSQQLRDASLGAADAPPRPVAGRRREDNMLGLGLVCGLSNL